MISHSDPYFSHNRGTKVALIIGLLVLIAVVATTMGGSSMLGLRMGKSGAFTQVKKLGGPPTLSHETSKGSEILSHEALESRPVTSQKPMDGPPVTLDAQVVKKMPKDVLDWLLHLERIENRREGLAQAQVADLMVQMAALQGAGASMDMLKGLLGDPESSQEPDDSGVQEVARSAAEQRTAWDELLKDFDSLAPPSECIATRNAYSQCLIETKTMIFEVMDAVDQSKEDPQAAIRGLLAMQGTSANRIDVAAKQSDKAANDVCTTYDVEKWFKISGDIAGGLPGPLTNLGKK